MGFYVNLEMPKDCPMCPFAHYDMFNTFRGCDITRGKRWAVTNDKDYAESSTRPDWCPLIEVPEPHGRLIDGDKVLDGLAHNIGICSLDYLTPNEWAIVSWFRDAPTIIPASEEAEENMRIQRRCSG